MYFTIRTNDHRKMKLKLSHPNLYVNFTLFDLRVLIHIYVCLIIYT